MIRPILNCIEKDAWYLVENELLKVSALLCTSIISKYQFKVHMLPTLSLFICPTKMVMVRLSYVLKYKVYTYKFSLFGALKLGLLGMRNTFAYV